MQPEADPDIRWVELLGATPRSTAESALSEAESLRDLYRHLDREHRSEGRRSYVEIDAPLELHALVRLLRPRHIVEVGVSSGVSSAYLLEALDRNGAGTLHSVDLPARPRSARPASASRGASWSIPRGRSSGWAVPRELRRRWDLRIGDKADLLPILASELPNVGPFVYDVPHEDRDARQEFGLFQRILSSGGVAIVDHGPYGGLCAGLRSWARSAGSVPIRRAGLGLFGFRQN